MLFLLLYHKNKLLKYIQHPFPPTFDRQQSYFGRWTLKYFYLNSSIRINYDGMLENLTRVKSATHCKPKVTYGWLGLSRVHLLYKSLNVNTHNVPFFGMCFSLSHSFFFLFFLILILIFFVKLFLTHNTYNNFYIYCNKMSSKECGVCI